jgi:hypothetical protein
MLNVQLLYWKLKVEYRVRHCPNGSSIPSIGNVLSQDACLDGSFSIAAM